MFKKPWVLFVLFIGWCWLCLHWFCCWMQVACPSCTDEQSSPYAIGHQLDSPTYAFGEGYTQLVTELLSAKKADHQLEITGKYYLNEVDGKKLAQVRAQKLAALLKEDLHLTQPAVLRSQKVWQAAPMPDTFFQAIELQWITAATSTLPLERNFYLQGRADDLQLSSDDLAYLKELVQLLGPDARSVQVSGHTDDIGNTVQNKKIGDLRAMVVVEALQDLGLSSDRITWTNEMDQAPLLPNISAANRAKNRRVFLKVIP